MKPPPPPIVSMRYFVPGASVLNPHLIPAVLVTSTNSIGPESFLAIRLGSSLANGQVTQIVEMSQAITMVFIGLLELTTNWIRNNSPLIGIMEKGNLWSPKSGNINDRRQASRPSWTDRC